MKESRGKSLVREKGGKDSPGLSDLIPECPGIYLEVRRDAGAETKGGELLVAGRENLGHAPVTRETGG